MNEDDEEDEDKLVLFSVSSVFIALAEVATKPFNSKVVIVKRLNFLSILTPISYF